MSGTRNMNSNSARRTAWACSSVRKIPSAKSEVEQLKHFGSTTIKIKVFFQMLTCD